MARKSQLPIADREEAVLRLLRKEEPVAALARRYQVSEQTLYRWREAFLAGGRERLRKGSRRRKDEAERRIAKLEKELGRRAQVIGELSIANDLLKKLQVYPG